MFLSELRGDSGRCDFKYWNCRAWLIIAIWFVALPATAQQAIPAGADAESPLAVAERVPPPRSEYLGRRIAPTMHFTGASWLLRSEREDEEHCQEMFEQLRIRPGMTVCDMGCGNGFYTLQMASRVGEQGRVLAVDIQQEMLRLLEARAAEADLDGIEWILGEVHDPHLPENELDLILCVDVYHEFSHPTEMLAAMRRALKPSGLLVLVEYREEDPSVPIKPLHKMSKRQVNKELTSNQFQLQREYDGLPWQHMMFFRRADLPPNHTDQSTATLPPTADE